MKRWKKLGILLLSAVMLTSSVTVYAEEDYAEQEEYADDVSDDEGEFIPEAYYDPIETNALYGWPQGPAVQAAGAIVMDMDTGAILYGKNLDQRHYPASITKIMTTMVALEHSSLTDTFTCGEEVYQIEADSTNLGIQDGEKLTMEQALHGVMLESANDLANAVAVHVAGSISAFADMMNAKAEELGCTNTHFVNPSGLHGEEHYTTARDMAKIATAAYAIPEFRTITAKTEYIIPKTNVTDEERGFLNHQKLLQKDTEYYMPWCTGGKTGYTTDAWNTLVTYAEQDGMRLVCVLLRENGAPKAYTETADLVNYALASFHHLETESEKDVPSFYDLLDLNYPNAGTTVIQSDALKQKAVQVVKPGLVTIPIGFTRDALQTSVQGDKVLYTYQDWPVGSMEVSFTPLPQLAPLPYEQKRDMETILKRSEERQREDELNKTMVLAVTQLQDGADSLIEKVTEAVQKNTMAVALIGALVLAVLVIMIIILIMRCTKESRIQRKRQAEQRARLRAEEDIDRMSAVEIEQQLRQAMDAEKEKRDRAEERRRRREAEEAELRETEEMLEKIKNS